MSNPRENQKDLNHAPVQSKSVKTIGYDEETGELHVTFHGTGRYVYQGVPKYVYESLMMSESKGNFLHHQIKRNYEFTKL